jgi:DNA-binding IclR family transcriptional regulator
MRAPQGRSLAEVSADLGLHRATALRLLRTLVAEDIMVRDDAGRYLPNPGLWLALAPLLRPARLLIAEVQGVLDALARETGGTTAVALPDETGRRAYAAMHGLPRGPVFVDPRAVEPVPLHATACGKCYLAALPQQKLAEYLRGGLESLTKATVVSAALLRRELRLVRRQGYALSRGEALEAVPAVAAPLTGPEGTAVGAVTLAFSSGVGDVDVCVAALPLVRTASEQISHLLSDESWSARVAALQVGLETRPSAWDAPEPSFGDAPTAVVRSASRALRLMALIVRAPLGLSVSQLARMRELDRSTTRRLLRTLEVEGLVRRDEITRRYRAHPLMWLRLSPAIRPAAPLVDTTREVLQRLADATGATVCLSVADTDGGHAVAVQYALPPGPMAYHPGRILPPALHASAAGKCLLAHRSSLELKRYTEKGLEAYTEKTVLSPRQLQRELTQVREAGFALNREESRRGLGGVAVPVTTTDGTVVAALALVPLIGALTESHLRAWLPALRAAAPLLSSVLTPGWQERLTQASS